MVDTDIFFCAGGILVEASNSLTPADCSAASRMRVSDANYPMHTRVCPECPSTVSTVLWTSPASALILKQSGLPTFGRPLVSVT